jgi:hypothetical protein
MGSKVRTATASTAMSVGGDHEDFTVSFGLAEVPPSSYASRWYGAFAGWKGSTTVLVTGSK